MPLEISKENKVKVSLNKQQVTTTYGKKEGTNRKKGKVLCDVITSASVPTKRPKVLTNVATIESSPLSSIDTSKKCADIDESITAVIDTVDLPLFYAVESSMLTDMTKQTKDLDVDTNSPCCSSHILTSRIPTTSANSILLPVSIQKPKKTGNFAGMSSSSSGNSLNVKKASSAVIRRSKFSNDNLLKSLKRGKKNLSKDNLRLKKKKLCKSDTNLKRKKSRVF